MPLQKLCMNTQGLVILFCPGMGPSYHWVTPSLGKGGQIRSSRHNYAATAPFPDLSTPLDSLIFLLVPWSQIGAENGRKS